MISYKSLAGISPNL